MKHHIHDDAWKTVATAIQIYWKDLSKKEVGKARRGVAALRKIIKARYRLTSAQAEVQVNAFISVYKQNTLAIRDTPRI